MTPQQHRHIFFDLDSTLTPSRAPMHPKHAVLFKQLCDTRDVVVVTGGAEEQIRKQIPDVAPENYFMLSQQGNYAVHKNGELLWHETVTPEQEQYARGFSKKLVETFLADENLPPVNPDDTFENRGSQLAASVLGFHAPNEKKYAADPDQSKRRTLLKRHGKEVSELRGLGMEVMPAGTTTFDFILLGKHKGHNIERLLRRMQWHKDDCIYVGDALFPGGNDESVIGVIDTYAVKTPEDTFAFVESILKSGV